MKYYANIKCYCREIFNDMEIYAISESKDYKSEYEDMHRRKTGRKPTEILARADVDAVRDGYEFILSWLFLFLYIYIFPAIHMHCLCINGAV